MLAVVEAMLAVMGGGGRWWAVVGGVDGEVVVMARRERDGVMA